MSIDTTDFSIEYACQLDQNDELGHYRNEFYLHGDRIYLDGNSLGLLSKRAEQSLLQLLDSWKQHGIDGWMGGTNPWFYLAEHLGELSAPLIGASPEEVIVTGSTTTNLHQMVATFYKPKGKKVKIAADELTFPSDIYAIQSQLMLKGYDADTHLIKVKSRDGRLLAEDDLIAEMSEEVALFVLPSVLYRSGQILDMKRLTAEAHRRGIIIGFDLCHSIGVIEHRLSEWGVDFAVWCNYKYVNGGPGSVAGLYVNKQHFSTRPGLAGWFSSQKEKQFDLEHVLHAADNSSAYQIGSPHILSMAPIIGSLELFGEAGLSSLREKSLQLTRYMMNLIEHELNGYGFVIANPREDCRRGGHIYIEHKEAARICKALKSNGIIPDFRAPSGIRLAPTAFYTSYQEVWKSIQVLKKIMVEEEYLQFENKREIIA